MNKGSEDDLRFDGAQMMPSRQPCSQQSEGHCSQKKKEQKENEEPSPVVDKPAPDDEAVEGCYSPTGLPTTGCCSLYKSRPDPQDLALS